MEHAIYQWAMLILGFIVGGLAGYAHAWHSGYKACQRELEEDFMQSAERRAREWRSE